jgi:hypothetical protein
MGLMTSGTCFAKVVWKVRCQEEGAAEGGARAAQGAQAGEGAHWQALGKAQNLVRPEQGLP